MATAALLNLAPSHLHFPASPAATFPWTNTIAMHVARPKSAKGRTRPRFACAQGVEACPCHEPPSPPAAPQELANSQGALLVKPALPSGHVSPEEIPELLQPVPLRSSCSLNKYRVLPSIGWKGAVEAVAEQTHQLKVGEDAAKTNAVSGEQGPARTSSGNAVESSHVPRPPEKPGRKMSQESPAMLTLGLEELPREEPHLLLAVRSPSGQRFEHHFKPTDSLQTVLAVAGQKTSAEYKHCSLETMEVPRRSFSDLARSLRECGIPHKSVLCIRREQQDAELLPPGAGAVGGSTEQDGQLPPEN